MTLNTLTTQGGLNDEALFEIEETETASVSPLEETNIDRLVELQDGEDRKAKKEEDTDEKEEVIVDLKTTDECIKCLREITCKLISVGVEHALGKLPQKLFL